MQTMRYKVTYWPLAFRGCFVTYLLAYADVAFAVEDDMAAIDRLKAQAVADQPTPLIGPPMLEDLETGIALNQVPAIVTYYAQSFGLAPQDPLQAARALKVLMDCNDLLMEICCYNGTSMWTREGWVQFRTERLPKWLGIFEEEIKRGTMGGDAVNFADIATCALFSPMMRCMPQLRPDLESAAPAVVALCDRIVAQPSLAAYIETEAQKYGTLYCGGQIEQSIRSQLALDG